MLQLVSKDLPPDVQRVLDDLQRKIEDKNSFIALQNISPYHSNWYSPLAWIMTFFWVSISVWIISNTYKKVHF